MDWPETDTAAMRSEKSKLPKPGAVHTHCEGGGIHPMDGVLLQSP